MFDEKWGVPTPFSKGGGVQPAAGSYSAVPGPVQTPPSGKKFWWPSYSSAKNIFWGRWPPLFLLVWDYCQQPFVLKHFGWFPVSWAGSFQKRNPRDVPACVPEVAQVFMRAQVQAWITNSQVHTFQVFRWEWLNTQCVYSYNFDHSGFWSRFKLRLKINFRFVEFGLFCFSRLQKCLICVVWGYQRWLGWGQQPIKRKHPPI